MCEEEQVSVFFFISYIGQYHTFDSMVFASTFVIFFVNLFK